MMLEEMREHDRHEAGMARNTVTSAETGDRKGIEEAILRARAERKIINQATISRRVARKTMEGVISAPGIVKYFREFKTNGRFAMDGRGTLEQ